jgi:hypothetical protein
MTGRGKSNYALTNVNLWLSVDRQRSPEWQARDQRAPSACAWRTVWRLSRNFRTIAVPHSGSRNVLVPGMYSFPHRTNESNTSPNATPFSVNVYAYRTGRS